ncbi:shufflon system plasmid conjugative transfer pilus tip adhesin PilV, partial [Acidiferrobacter sp.]|uniref:shufflon system plasmid conjugative transfer pilus tip adhesin PilV n=1 Tax=Acidiferrobacter sp. TaxID=1872107 RepID=UPI00260500CF
MPAIFGVLLAIALLLEMVPIATQEAVQGAATVRAHEVASQAHAIALAVEGYVQSNYAAILANTAGGPQTIPLSALVTTGYLPAGTSAVDAYDQTWQVSFYQPAANDIDALINVTGGRPVHPDMLPALAAEIGQQGGFQPNSGNGLYNADAGDAIGAFGGWKVPVASFGLAPQPGTPAALVYFNSGTVSSTYLYRVAVPGNPQVNTMQTNLNTGGNAVTNTGTVQFTTNPASGVIYQGEGCGSNGAIGTNSNGSGQLMVCQGGSWQPAAPPPHLTLALFEEIGGCNGCTSYVGWYTQCNISGIMVGGHGANTNNRIDYTYPVAGPNSQGQYLW